MEEIYVSGQLINCDEFYSEFSLLIQGNNIDIIELPYTKDIWCRDFMPVRSRSGKNLLFNYDPSYLKGKWQHKLTLRKDIIDMLIELEILFEQIDDIKLEGGNVVQKDDLVIMTDAIYRENGLKDDKRKQSKLIERLENYFQSEIIIIPHQPDDPLSHSDGVVRFLNDKTVLVNDFSSVKVEKLEESKHYLDNLFGALGKAGLNILQVPYSPVDEIGEDEMPVALGIYINYLETNDFIFLPQFGKDLKEKDAEALQVFNNIFKSLNKDVIPVNSRAIALKGGVLNCITWN